MNTQKRWQDWVKGIAGLWLFLSPWVLGVTGDSASSWNGWIVGLLIIIGSVVALRAPHGLGSQWFVGIVGLWLVLSPAIITVAAEMVWTCVIVGILAAVLSLWTIGSEQGGAR